jgi:AcrR family transcriptional regulator
MKAAPPRTVRERLTRERVVGAALRIMDAEGLDAVTMRRIGRDLGVEAMSLYNHVENKDDLVRGILDLVEGEIEGPEAGRDWKAELHRSVVSAHETFSRHPWAAQIWMSSPRGGGRGMRRAEAMLRYLREAGFPEGLTYHAFHVLNAYSLGYTLQESSFGFDIEQIERMAARFLRDFPTDEYPYLAEHIRQHTEPGEHRHGNFEFGLDLVLDGLERLRDAR